MHLFHRFLTLNCPLMKCNRSRILVQNLDSMDLSCKILFRDYFSLLNIIIFLFFILVPKTIRSFRGKNKNNFIYIFYSDKNIR